MKTREWTEERIYFMEVASSYSGYYEKLGALIHSYVPYSINVCDAGCGIGSLSIALSSYYERVTGADISHSAIEALKKSIEKKHCNNVKAKEVDLNSLLGIVPKYDLMIFNYFGSLSQALDIGKRLCNGTLIIIKKNYTHHRFSIGSCPIISDIKEDVNEVIKNRCPNAIEKYFEFEMGQPLRTIEEGKLFYQLYSNDQNPNIITSETILSKIVETGRDDFPYYIPQVRKSRLIIVKTKDII